MSDFFKSIGAGLASSAVGFMLGGPIGAAAGMGIGMLTSAQGMQGKDGTMTGALMGGLAGMAFGPIGAIGGGLLGAMGGKLISKLFNKHHNQNTQQYGNNYPQMPPYMMGGYGQMGMGGMQMPMMGMGGMGMGMQMGGMGMGMQMGGMQMSMGMFGGFGMTMSMGMFGSTGMMGMGMFGMQQPIQGGQLKQEGQGKPIEYTTHGGYKVQVNGHDVIITDPTGKNTVKHWGDPHEQVNGKAIKDWEGKDRTLILGDGTKITMNADGPQGVINSTSIYDGNQAISINNKNNTVENVSFNPYQSKMQEMYQPDGETSYVGFNNNGQFVYNNLYTQDQNLGVRQNFKQLATGSESGWQGFQFPMFSALGLF